MKGKERLYEVIEEAARTKNPIHLEIKEGDCLQLRMISDTKFLVEDLFWDDGKHVCQAVLEAGFEKRVGLILPGLYVAGHNNQDGTGSRRTTMFRKNKRHIFWDVHEQDNIPNPFEDLTLEELYFLREHKHLLEKIKL